MLRLELAESLPVGVEIRFNNIVNESSAGNKQVFVGWDQPLIKYDLSRSLVNTTDTVKTYLIDFFESVIGAKDVFRYQDLSDYKVTNTEFTSGLSTDKTYGIGISNIDGSQYQLYKVYELEEIKSYRAITRPVDNDKFKIYDDVIEITTGFTVDFETGVITFDTPNPNLDLFWTGEFDIPVRFSADTISFIRELLAVENCREGLYEIPSFEIEEVREKALVYPLPDVLPETINHTFALDLAIREQEDIKSNTSITVFDSGWEIRESNYVINNKPSFYREIITGEDPLCDAKDIHYLLCLWRCTRGGAIVFEYNEYQAQARDNLSFDISLEDCTKIYQGENYSLFDLSGLKLQLKKQSLTAPALPEFFATLANFDISNLNLTENSSLPSENNFTTYGGGSTVGSAGGSTTNAPNSNSNGESAISIGTASASFNNYGLVLNQTIPLSIGYFSGQIAIMLARFVNLSGSSNDRFQFHLARSTSGASGSITFDVSDPFTGSNTTPNITYGISANVTRTIPWVWDNDKYYYGFQNAEFGVTTSEDFVICEVTPTDFNFQIQSCKSIVVSNYPIAKTFIDEITGDIILPSLSSPDIRFEPFSFQGKNVNISRFNVATDLSGTDENEGEFVLPIWSKNPLIYNSSFSVDDIGSQLRPRTGGWIYEDSSGAARLYKTTSPTTREIWYEFNGFNLLTQDEWFWKDTSTGEAYQLFRLSGCTDATFPHTNQSASDPAEDYFLIFRVTYTKEPELIGSWSLTSLINYTSFPSNQINSSVFGTSNYYHETCFKGWYLSRRNILLNFETGAIYNLDNVSGFPSSTSITTVHCSSNGIVAMNGNEIAFLSINTA